MSLLNFGTSLHPCRVKVGCGPAGRDDVDPETHTICTTNCKIKLNSHFINICQGFWNPLETCLSQWDEIDAAYLTAATWSSVKVPVWVWTCCDTEKVGKLDIVLCAKADAPFKGVFFQNGSFLFVFYWSTNDLQCCFRCTAKWFS